MSKENLLEIINALNTDTVFQKKVISLYADYTSKQYAWQKHYMTYGEFYDLFHKAYVQAVSQSKEIKKFNFEKIFSDRGEDYECFFTYGKIYSNFHENFEDGLVLPSFGLNCDECDQYYPADDLNEAEVKYLHSKNIRLWDLEALNLTDGNVAYRTKEEWEDIIFNAPLSDTECVISGINYDISVESKFNIAWIEKRVKELDLEFKKIKSLDQLSKEMPALLSKCYDLLETLTK